MPINKIFITVDGKEHEVPQTHFDEDGGAPAYASAYNGSTIRMKDDEGDYDIPLSDYDKAVSSGLRPFVMSRYAKGEAPLAEHKDVPGIENVKVGVPSGNIPESLVSPSPFQKMENYVEENPTLVAADRPEIFKSAIIDELANKPIKGVSEYSPIEPDDVRTSRLKKEQKAREDEFWNTQLLPEVESQIKASRKKGIEKELAFYRGMSGAPSTAAVGISILGGKVYANETDYGKIIKSVNDYLDDKFAVKSDSADNSAMDVTPVQDDVRGRILKRVYDYLVQKEMPASSIEYILKNAFNGSLMGSLLSLGKSRDQLDIEQSANDKYGPNWAERGVSGAGSLVMDAPAFMLTGGLGNLAAKGTLSVAKKGIVKQLMAEGASEIAAKETAKRIIQANVPKYIAGRVAAGAIAGGVNFGAYDMAHNVMQQALSDEDFSVGKLLESGAKGLVKGAAFGSLGSTSAYLSRNLKGAAKAAAKVGTLGGEIGLFTGLGVGEQLLNGVEFEDIDLGEDILVNAATILALKAKHPGDFLSSKGKLDDNGKMLNNLRFTNDQKRELDNVGYDANRMESMIGKFLERGSEKPYYINDIENRFISDDYVNVMNNSNISQGTKAKLLYLVEGKLSSRPPLMTDYKLSDDGKSVTTFDAMGRKIDTISFDSDRQMNDYLSSNEMDRKKETNKILVAEEMNDRMVNDIYNKQAVRDYAESNGIGIDLVSEIITKKAQGEKLTAEENNVIEGVRQLKEADAYYRKSMSFGVSEVINEEYGIDINESILKPAKERTPEEQNAIEKYTETLLNRIPVAESKEYTWWDVASPKMIEEESKVAYNSGKEKTEPIEKHQLKVDYNDVGNKIEQRFGGDFRKNIDTFIQEGYKANELIETLKWEGYNNEQIGSAIEYYNSYQSYKGAQDKIKEDVDNIVSFANEEARANVNFSTDRITNVRALTENGGLLDGYVVGGNLAYGDDKIIDSNLSDEVLYFRDSEGRVHPIVPKDVKEILSDDLLDDVISRNEQELRTEVMHEKNAEVDFAPGIPEPQLGNDFSYNGINYTILDIDPANGDMLVIDSELLQEVGKNDEKAQEVIGKNAIALSNNEYKGILSKQIDDESASKGNIPSQPTEKNIESSGKDEAIVRSDGEQQSNAGLQFSLEGADNQELKINKGEEKISELEKIMQDLPKKKDGSLDYENMTPDQQYEYTSLKESPQVASDDLKAYISAENEELQKLQDSFSETVGSKRTKLRDTIQEKEARIGELNELYSNVKPTGLAEETGTDRVPEDVQTDEEYIEWVAENSDDVDEVLSAYKSSKELASHEMTLQPWQRELLGRKISTSSFYRFGDRNHITGSLAKSWLRKDGQEIDAIAQELSENGVEVTEQDIVGFMLDNPSNYVGQISDTMRSLSSKFSRIATKEMGIPVSGPESNTGKLYLKFKKANQKLGELTEGQKYEKQQAIATDMEASDQERETWYYEALDNYAQQYDQYRNEVEEDAADEAIIQVLEKDKPELYHGGFTADELDDIYSQIENNNGTERQTEDSRENQSPLFGEEVEKLEKYGTPRVSATENSKNGEKNSGVVSNEQIENVEEQNHASAEQLKVGDVPEVKLSSLDQKDGNNALDFEDKSIFLNDNNQKVNENGQISESISQGEHGTLSEISGEQEESIYQLRRRIEEASRDASESEGSRGNQQEIKPIGVGSFGAIYNQSNKEAATPIDKKTDTGEIQIDLQSDTALLQDVGSSSVDRDSELSVNKQKNPRFTAPQPEAGEDLIDYASRISGAKRLFDAEQEVDTNPTEAQKSAGNYKKGHINIGGFDITIENPKGSERSGVDANGQPWSVTMNNSYGYIRGTEGVDGDHIDVFLSDNPADGKVYVIDQMNEDGSFDEHKVMYNFPSEEVAREAYLANYSPGWQGLGAISEVSKDEFKKWIDSSRRKTKPFVDYKSVEASKRKRRGFSNLGKGEQIIGTEDKFKKEKGKFSNQDPRTNDYARVLQESKTVEEAIVAFEKMAKEQREIANDWRSRMYKKNDTIVEGEKGLDPYETTISNANERRRMTNIRAAEKRASEIEGYIDILKRRTGYKKEEETVGKNQGEITEKLAFPQENSGETAVNLPKSRSNAKNKKRAADIKRARYELMDAKRELSVAQATNSGYIPEEVEEKKKRVEEAENELKKLAGIKNEDKSVLSVTSSSKSESALEIPAMTEEEYIASKGYGFSGIGEPALHKGKQKSANLQDKNVERQATKDKEYVARREELRKEYREKLEKGELREPTTVERLLKSANGNSDLESTQAARRSLKKRGIDWRQDDGVRFQVVHHGSGSSFDKFSVEKIGSGEGNQSFGWGLYFTDKKDIAQYYAETIGNMPTYVLHKDGKPADMSDQVARIIYNFDGSVKKAIASNKRSLKIWEKEGDEELVAEIRKQIVLLEKENPKAWKLEEIGNRHLYDVEIPNTGFLHWDNSLSDEHKKLISAQAEKEGMKISFYGDMLSPEEYFQKMGENAEGSQVYKAIGKTLGNAQAASEFLSRAGFNGIEYIAGRHSGKKSTDSNFVVFDDKAVRIINHLRYQNMDDSDNFSSISRKRLNKLMEVLKKNGLAKDVVTDKQKMREVLDDIFGSRMHSVFHGSSHEFEQFDHSFMGSGEGAQAYGWGTYVTEVNGIAKQYAGLGESAIRYQMDRLSELFHVAQEKIDRLPDEIAVGKQRLEEFKKEYSDFTEERIHLMNEYGEDSAEYQNFLFNHDEEWLYESRIKAVENQIRFNEEDLSERKKDVHTLKAEMEELRNSVPRYLYTVEIPDNNGNNYLVWNKPVGPDVVKKVADALSGMGFNELPSLNDGWFRFGRLINGENKKVVIRPDVNGSDLYYELSSFLDDDTRGVPTNGDKDSSLLLGSIGYKGIEYPAELRTGGRADNARNYVIFNEYDANISNRERLMSTPSGEVYGFVTPDNTIYLDPDKLNANTPIHEYGHLWNGFIKKNNSELYARGSELIKESPYWQAVNENPAYSNLSEEEKVDEALASAIGDKGERMMKNGNILGFAQLKAWLYELWNAIKKVFGFDRKLDIENMELDDFSKNAVRDLTSGNNLLERKVGNKLSSIGENQQNVNSNIKLQSTKEENVAKQKKTNDFSSINEREDDDYNRSLEAVAHFTQKYAGTGKTLVISSKESMRKQLEEYGISENDIVDLEKRIMDNKSLAAFNPAANMIIILKTDVAEKDINNYLWHENTHKAIREIFGDDVENAIEPVYEWLDSKQPDKCRLIKEQYSSESEAVKKEECVVAFFENMFSYKGAEALKCVIDEVPDVYRKDFFTKLFNNIVYGTGKEKGSNGGVRGDLGTEHMEMRNSGGDDAYSEAGGSGRNELFRLPKNETARTSEKLGENSKEFRNDGGRIRSIHSKEGEGDVDGERDAPDIGFKDKSGSREIPGFRFRVDDDPRPIKKNGESFKDYSKRLQEWKDRQNMKEMTIMNGDEYIKALSEMMGVSPEEMKDKVSNEELNDVKRRLDEQKRVDKIIRDAEAERPGAAAEYLAEKAAVTGLNHAEKVAYQRLANEIGIDTSKDGLRRAWRDEKIQRRRFIETSNLETSFFVSDIKKKTTKAQRKDIPFIIEGTYEGKVSDKMAKVVADIQKWFDDKYDELLQEGVAYGSQKLNNYVTHIWDTRRSDKEALQAYNNMLKLRSPYTRHRVIDTLAKGIEMGLVPKYDDITDIMQDYGQVAHLTIANKHLLDFMKGLSIHIDKPMPVDMPLLIPSDQIDADYVSIQNDTLTGYKVHRSMEHEVSTIFGPDAAWKYKGNDDTMLGDKIWKVYDLAGSYAKRITLGLSGFHAGALTESAIAGLNPIQFSKIMAKNMIWDSLIHGKLPTMIDRETAMDAVGHMVQLGASSDYDARNVGNITTRMAKWAEDVAKRHPNIPAKTQKWLLEFVDDVNKGIDKVLWSWMHDSYKMYTYKEYANAWKKKCESKGYDPDTLEKGLNNIGQMINDQFGGQHWELLNVTPQQLLSLKRLLLSPDWNISAVRQFLALSGKMSYYDATDFKGDKNVKHGTDPTRGFQRGRAASFWITAMLFFGAGFQGVNALLRDADVERERKKAKEIRKVNPGYKSSYEIKYPDGMQWYDYTMYGNSPGKRTDLFTGRNSDGTEIYARWGKQFREVVELIYGHSGFDIPQNIIDKLKGKSNPNFNILSVLMNGETLSGYKPDILKETENKNPFAKWAGRVALLMNNNLMPWSVSDLLSPEDGKDWKAISLVMPTSKGFTNYKAKAMMEDGLKGGNIEVVEDAYNAAVVNGLDADKLLDVAIKSVEALSKKEFDDGISTLQEAVSAFDKESDLKKKAALRTKLKKFLAEEEYLVYNKQESLEKAMREIFGEEPERDASEIYEKIETSDDVRQEYEVRKIMTRCKPTYEKYKDLYESKGQEAEVFGKQNRQMIELYIQGKKTQSLSSRIKKAFGTEKGQRTMEEIRRIRREYIDRAREVY